MQLLPRSHRLCGSFLLLALCSVALVIDITGASYCPFLPKVPIIEYNIPSYQHTLKFLDVDAKIYRTTITSGTTPRIRILKYSAVPIIDLDHDSKEILISTKASTCSGGSKIMSRTTWISSVGTVLAFAVAGGFSWTSGFAFFGASLLLALNNGGSVFASAADASCTHALEVVIEAPSYYLGSVDTCLAEVENPDHCPLPFPTFKECSDPAPSCKIAVVGAGAGGLYTAMRLIEEKKVKGSDVCIFEATDRVGGRLYSVRGFGPENDITVDAGGYRTWPEFTPVLHELITTKLGLKVDCYEKIENCERYNIVGNNGEKIGFASFVEKMMEILLEAGVCYFSRHNLVSIETDVKSGMPKNTLYFANGVVATNTEIVILNVPQRPLLQILRKSKIPMTEDQEAAVYDSLHSVQTEIASKLYLYYSDAWWPKLGLLTGDFAKSGDARNMLLAGRYHDGHIKCKNNNNNACYGFLLAVYSHDFSGNKAQFFRRYQKDRPEPVTIISNTDVEGREFLKHAHERLVEYHMYDEHNKTYTGFEASQVFAKAQPPEFAVLSTWNIATFGAGGAWHGWTDLDNVEGAMFPLNSVNIHVINEAFSKLQGWAEGSLQLADEVLEKYFDVSRPWSFQATSVPLQLSQTSSDTCVDNGSGGSGGGSGGGGSGGGGGDGGGPDLCFTADALVHMADGSVKQIVDVTVGDYVDTGLLGGTGRITEFLKHDVFDYVKVAVISTEHGELVGTVNHPIHVDGDWYQIDEAFEMGLFEKIGINVHIEMRYVESFYNLEVDGNYESFGSSSHSYKVNGVVASGLGDNPALNQMYKRQKIWKQEKPFTHEAIVSSA